MKVEILEEILSSDGYYATRGDVLTVPEHIGTDWCRHGWAKDPDGVVATGERRVVSATVTPRPAGHKQTAQEG